MINYDSSKDTIIKQSLEELRVFVLMVLSFQSNKYFKKWKKRKQEKDMMVDIIMLCCFCSLPTRCLLSKRTNIYFLFSERSFQLPLEITEDRKISSKQIDPFPRHPFLCAFQSQHLACDPVIADLFFNFLSPQIMNLLKTKIVSSLFLYPLYLAQ